MKKKKKDDNCRCDIRRKALEAVLGLSAHMNGSAERVFKSHDFVLAKVDLSVYPTFFYHFLLLTSLLKLYQDLYTIVVCALSVMALTTGRNKSTKKRKRKIRREKKNKSIKKLEQNLENITARKGIPYTQNSFTESRKEH